MAMAAAGAMAVSTSAFGQTVVVNAGSCDVLDAEGSEVTIVDAGGGGDAVVQGVFTESGNQKVTCNGTLPSGALPERGAVLLDFESTGRECQTFVGSTTDWHQVVTSSGRVALTCHVNAQ